MYKIKLKQWVECNRLHNVITTVQNMRNSAVDAKRQAKKDKDKELSERKQREIEKYEQDILDLQERLRKAKQEDEKKSLECAIMRTKVYVISYSLQGAVFDLKEFLKANAVADGGESGYLTELQKCSDLLMKMPMEFGTYGDDNEAYNICEEIVSREIDRGVRAAFDEMLAQDLAELQRKYNRK